MRKKRICTTSWSVPCMRTHTCLHPHTHGHTFAQVNAPDWGAVGPVKEPTVGTLPRKPNKKQRSTTISPRSKKPRDRLAEGAITFTGDSRKLPAPPLGESTGHGLYPRTAVNTRNQRGQIPTHRFCMIAFVCFKRLSQFEGATKVIPYWIKIDADSHFKFNTTISGGSGRQSAHCSVISVQ